MTKVDQIVEKIGEVEIMCLPGWYSIRSCKWHYHSQNNVISGTLSAEGPNINAAAVRLLKRIADGEAFPGWHCDSECPKYDNCDI